jgi:tRNA dimethylallyltransferase
MLKSFFEENHQKQLSEYSKIIVILGTNASGKSSIGLELAKIFHGEIISADSRQVYKGFDLCSGKVTKEEMAMIPHHMININNINEPFSMADFQKKTYTLIPEIINRGNTPFIVGGTGLYIDSIVKGYILTDNQPDYELRKNLNEKTLPELHNELSVMVSNYSIKNNSEYFNKRRIIRLIEKFNKGESLENTYTSQYNSLLLGVTWDKEILHGRIDERLTARLESGMINEVDLYLKSGGNPEYLINLGLEYRYIYWYLTGKIKSYDIFYEELSKAIKKFSKRQLTWFKKNDKIIWLDMNGDYINQAKEIITKFLQQK